MKTILLFLFATQFCFLYGQSPLTVYTPTVLPQNPTTGDSVKVLVKVQATSGSSKVSKTSSVNGTNVNLSSCIMLNMLTVISYQTDTFNLGILPAGVYNISYTANPTYTTSCTPSSNSVTTSGSFTVSQATGIKEQSAEYAVSVFPNPFSNKITIAAKGIESVKSVSITDILGRTVYSVKEVKVGSEININNLTPGVYWLRADVADQKKTIKLVKE